MKPTRNIYLISVFVLALAQALQAQEEPDPTQEKLKARAAFEKSMVQLRLAEAAGNKEKIQQARAGMLTAQMVYKNSAYQELQANLSRIPERNRPMYVYKQKPELYQNRLNHEQSVIKTAEQRYNARKSDQAYRTAMASDEAMVRMKMIDEEVNEMQIRQYRPTEKRFYNKASTVHDQMVTAKVHRMSRLMEAIEQTDYNESYAKGPKGDMEKMIKRAQYERNMQEYRTLAGRRDWTDPRTGKPLSGLMQDKARANAMQALEQRVRKRSHDGGVPESFVNYFTGDKKDSRLETAGRLYAERMNDVRTQALTRLEGKSASPQEHYSAMALSIQKKREDLQNWYINDYLKTPNENRDGVLKQWFNLGMGTAKRSIMDDSEDGINTVKRRIDAVLANADMATAALVSASHQKISDLPKKQLQFLMSNDIIVKDKAGKLVYQVPQHTTGLNKVTDTKRDKSPWLDVVSVRSTAQTGLAMATGSGSAAFAQKLAQIGNLSEKTVAGLSVLTEVTASSGMDALINVADGKKADFDKALMQNLTMSGIGKLTGGMGEEFLSRNKSWKEAIEESGKNGIFRELMGKTSDGEKILRSDQAKRFIAQMAGASTDAAVETMYQAATSGGPIDEDAFMANLLQGAMTKAASNAIKAGGGKTKETFLKYLPEGLREYVVNKPEAMAEAFTRARKSEQHAQDALDRFETVKKRADGGGMLSMLKRRRSDAELFNDPDFANHVVDSLKKGEMRWSDLGIIAEKNGTTVSDLLHAVKDKRTRWAYGVSEPDAESAKTRAVENLQAEMRKDLAKIESGSGTVGDKQAAIASRKAEFQKTVELLGEKSDTAEGRAASKALGKASGELFNEAVMRDGVGAEVKDRAMRELKREYENKRDEIKRQHFFGKGDDAISEAQMKERLRAMDAEEAKVANDIRNAKMIAPGSGDPTSDIDRSWSEPRVVQAMKGLQRDRLMLEREGVKGIGPTTAKAWDLNEYYNVMDGVKAAMPLRNDPDKGFANHKVRVDGVGTLSHDDVVAGNIRASAMSHMSPEHRKLYEQNALKEVHGDPKKTEQVRREFEVAKRELEQSEKRITTARQEVAKRTGLDPDSHEAEIYARDKVYGETMRKVKALDNEIAELEPGSSAWKTKQSQRERLMNRASRDGIEAYTDAASLEVIVNRMQQETNADGSKKTVQDLWGDDQFNRNGKLSQFSERQLDNMMNDQVMMISEHLNAYQDGSETAYQTARALAKYGQRAALVAKMNGKDLPEGHPLRKLFDETSALMKHKGDPAEMLEALKKLGGDGGSVRDGLRELVGMTENAVPGLKGYTSVPRPEGSRAAADAPDGFSSLSSYKDWLRERDKRYEEGGQSAVNRWIDNQKDGIAAQRNYLEQEGEELSKLGDEYLPEDFSRARKLLDAHDALIQELNSLPVTIEPSERYLEILKKMEAIERQLEGLRGRRRDYIKEHGGPPENKDLAQVNKELDILQSRNAMLERMARGRPPVWKNVPPNMAAEDILLEELFEGEEDLQPDGADGGSSIIDALNDAFEKVRDVAD